MKRSKIVVQMARYYNLKQTQLEEGSMTPMEFFSNVLSIAEDLGMIPPSNPNEYDLVPTVTPTGNFDYSYRHGWEVE